MKGRERGGKRLRDKGPCRLCEGLSLCTENSGTYRTIVVLQYRKGIDAGTPAQVRNSWGFLSSITKWCGICI